MPHRRADNSVSTGTNHDGQQRHHVFSTSGGRGTYTLRVNNLTKTGYTFDPANSVLTKSITK